MSAGMAVRKGEVAALCGLILAGCSYTKACKIMRLPERRMAEYVPKDFRVRTQPARRWTAEALEELKEYWMANERTSIIAARFGLNVRTISDIVQREGWVLRPKGPPPNPKAIRQQPPKTRKLYRKMRDVIGPEKAKHELGLDQP